MIPYIIGVVLLLAASTAVGGPVGTVVGFGVGLVIVGVTQVWTPIKKSSGDGNESIEDAVKDTLADPDAGKRAAKRKVLHQPHAGRQNHGLLHDRAGRGFRRSRHQNDRRAQGGQVHP